MKDMWEYIKATCNLVAEENSTSVFVIESVRWTMEDRAQMARLLFDDHAPSVCFGNSASLSIFASGRTTGLAVECGAGLTVAAPVFEGLVLKHAVTQSEFGGMDITAELKRLFADRRHHLDLESTKTVKEKYSRCSVTPVLESNLSKNSEPFTFCLPDGNDVTVDNRIFTHCTESLFQSTKANYGGLMSQVHESIMLCDDSLKRELTQNIIMSGGTSMIPGKKRYLSHFKLQITCTVINPKIR